MRNVILTAAVLALVACSSDDKDYDATGMFEATEVIVSAEQTGRLMYFDIDDNDPDSEYTTVGGLILDELEHVPIAGEKATWRDFSFEVVDMDGARIDKVIVKRIRKEETPAEQI